MNFIPAGHIRRRALPFLILWAAAHPAQAADWLLAAPEPRVKPGQTFEVVVIGEPEGKGWPQSLPAVIQLSGNGPRVAVELTAAGEPGPSRQRYIGQWPGEIVGVATLALTDATRARLLIDARPLSEPSTTLSSGNLAATLPIETPITGVGADLISPATAADTIVEPAALGFHEPMYLVLGGSAPQGARFQISFRYRLFNDKGWIVKNLPIMGGLYAAYTQTSLWDLKSDSKPFRDTSFRPSVFYQVKLTNPLLGDSATLAGGYEHESNGKGGADSRSIDTWFLRANVRYHLPDGRTFVSIEPKVLSYIDKEDNPDIARYRGHGQLGLSIGRDSGLLLSAILRRGTAHGSTQLDLSYPLRQSIFSGAGAFVHLQYFNGYGQSLLDYSKAEHSQFRLGVSLVR
jgi:outer membrane phospholipase A